MAEFCCWCDGQVLGPAVKSPRGHLMHQGCAASVGLHAMLQHPNGMSPPSPEFTFIEPDPIEWEDTSARR